MTTILISITCTHIGVKLGLREGIIDNSLLDEQNPNAKAYQADKQSNGSEGYCP